MLNNFPSLVCIETNKSVLAPGWKFQFTKICHYRQDSYSVASYGSPEQGTFPHPQDLRDFRYASMSRMPGSNMDRWAQS